MAMLESFLIIDDNLFWLINSAHTPLLDMVFAMVTFLGSGWVAGPVLAVIILWKVPRNARVHAMAAVAIALSLSGVVNSQVKSLVDRPRPVKYYSGLRAEALEKGADLPVTAGRGPLIPHVVGPVFKHRSFPSGHANTAFAAATVLYILFGGWWTPLGFAAAAAVAYSRVYMGAHFPLDTIAGGLTGIILTMLTLTIYGRFAAVTAAENRPKNRP